MAVHHVSSEVGGRLLTIETGKLARQADGAVLVSYGDTRVLVTVCSSKEPSENLDFFPLTVEFLEKYYASGKIPGGFLKREGRPSVEATLSARKIDRFIRPLFPEGYYYETQIIVTVLSADPEGDFEIAGAIGASAALHISDIPFYSPTAACRIGRIQGQYQVNPSWSQLASEEKDLEIVVAGTHHAIMMVEGGAQEVQEEILEAILKGHQEIKNIIQIIEELRNQCGQIKRTFTPSSITPELKIQIEKHAKIQLEKALQIKEKQLRHELISQSKKATLEALMAPFLGETPTLETKKLEKSIIHAFENLKYQLMREKILNSNIRIDGRDSKTIRPIFTEVGLLPRVHGSALFTRGETQVLSAVTLGTIDDEQMIDSLYQYAAKKFSLQYHFPPFSVGEVGRVGTQSRREIGHGTLAERSLQALLPKHEAFPYTIRVVCETLESNGSSSMGSVCSASMALMDAGIPMKKAVSGIAMGLIKEGDQIAILSDILGDEDHLGDMDFKVAGTQTGITGIQMDIKIEGVNAKIIQQALSQAREGRIHILNEMAKSIRTPKNQLSSFAPQIIQMTVPIEKIREVIGTGGKVIREIIAQTKCKINIQDDGKVHIASTDSLAAQEAINLIQAIIAEVELGEVYTGVVKKIVHFGAFIALHNQQGLFHKQEGLLHIKDISHEKINNILDHLHEGQKVQVKVMSIDKISKKISLSRKILLPIQQGAPSSLEQSNKKQSHPANFDKKTHLK